jgi:type IV pilus assembly protein PilP
VRPNSNRNREHLEQFSLDTLAMVGTMRISGRNFALIKTRDGVVHRVLAGNYLGQNEGRVVAIEPSKITLTEIVTDGLGGFMERPATLNLAE